MNLSVNVVSLLPTKQTNKQKHNNNCGARGQNAQLLQQLPYKIRNQLNSYSPKVDPQPVTYYTLLNMEATLNT